MYMLTKIKNLSKGAKAALGAGVALLAAAGIGLGIWQPWNRAPQEPDAPVTPPQQVQGPSQPEVQGPQIQVGSETVNCTVYTGEGWSICVPEDWTAEQAGENGARLTSGDGAEMAVEFLPGSDYAGNFVSLSGDGAERTLRFYAGIGEGSPVITAAAPADRWREYEKLFAALARTLTVGTEKPFGEVFVVPPEPDWQEAEGLTVLFLDKDGYVLDDKIQNAVESYMLSWPDETKAAHTGQYRVNGIGWHSTFTGLRDGYIDVFRASVSYEQTGGGWSLPTEGVLAAVYHDGGSVEKTKWLDESVVRSLPELAAQLKG